MRLWHGLRRLRRALARSSAVARHAVARYTASSTHACRRRLAATSRPLAAGAIATALVVTPRLEYEALGGIIRANHLKKKLDEEKFAIMFS